MTVIILLIVGIGIYLLFKYKNENNYNYENTDLNFKELEYDCPIQLEKKELSLEQVLRKIEVVIQKDDFEDTILFNFNNIGEEGFKYLRMYFEKIGDQFISHKYIGISFSIFQNIIFLDIFSNFQEMGLVKGDELIFIFGNGDKIYIKFPLTRSSTYIKSNSYPIGNAELKIFADQKLDKWKLISIRKNSYIVGDNSIFHENSGVFTKNIAQEIIQHLAKTIIYIQDNNFKNNKEYLE